MDVLVIGAGPAGATAARRLALGGARVRLLDRHRFPRHKPCGGAISARVLDRFPGLRQALTRIPTREISHLHLESPGAERIDVRSSSPAVLMVRRVEFDDLLVRLAVEAGVELVEGAEVTQAAETSRGVRVTTRAGRVFSAPMAVAADGVHSVVARRLGLNTGWPRRAVALDLREETPVEMLRAVDPEALWVSYGHQGGHGYAYVFPKRGHVNVGVGYLLSYYRHRVQLPPFDLQRRFVDSLVDRHVLDGRSSRRHFTPFLIPVGGPLPRTAGGRVLLAGDAGGFVNGFTAEGIYYAMVTGDLAAAALLAGRPRHYPVAWRREIGRELRDAVWVQRHLFSDPRRIDEMVRGAHAHPLLTANLVAYATGRRSYVAARRRLVARLPLVAARLVLSGWAAA